MRMSAGRSTAQQLHFQKSGALRKSCAPSRLSRVPYRSWNRAGGSSERASGSGQQLRAESGQVSAWSAACPLLDRGRKSPSRQG